MRSIASIAKRKIASIAKRKIASIAKRTFASFVLLSSALLASSFAYAAFTVPQLAGPVVDEAGIIQADQARDLDAALRSVRDQGGPQINVVTIRSLEGETIETASIKITDAWKLGGAKADNGVLFLIALEDRKLRIEVGQGLEGVLTDLDSKRIISNQVTPLFRAGRSSDGIVAGVHGILEKVAPDQLRQLGEEPAQAPRARKSRDRGLPWPFIVGLLLLFAFFGRGRGGRGRGLLTGMALGSLASSGRRGGGWGGGGGGGSWSGGGGGFSGGGASGGW